MCSLEIFAGTLRSSVKDCRWKWAILCRRLAADDKSARDVLLSCVMLLPGGRYRGRNQPDGRQWQVDRFLVLGPTLLNALRLEHVEEREMTFFLFCLFSLLFFYRSNEVAS